MSVSADPLDYIQLYSRIHAESKSLDKFLRDLDTNPIANLALASFENELNYHLGQINDFRLFKASLLNDNQEISNCIAKYNDKIELLNKKVTSLTAIKNIIKSGSTNNATEYNSNPTQQKTSTALAIPKNATVGKSVSSVSIKSRKIWFQKVLQFISQQHQKLPPRLDSFVVLKGKDSNGKPVQLSIKFSYYLLFQQALSRLPSNKTPKPSNLKITVEDSTPQVLKKESLTSATVSVEPGIDAGCVQQDVKTELDCQQTQEFNLSTPQKPQLTIAIEDSTKEPDEIEILKSPGKSESTEIAANEQTQTLLTSESDENQTQTLDQLTSDTANQNGAIENRGSEITENACLGHPIELTSKEAMVTEVLSKSSSPASSPVSSTVQQVALNAAETELSLSNIYIPPQTLDPIEVGSLVGGNDATQDLSNKNDSPPVPASQSLAESPKDENFQLISSTVTPKQSNLEENNADSMPKDVNNADESLTTPNVETDDGVLIEAAEGTEEAKTTPTPPKVESSLPYKPDSFLTSLGNTFYSWWK